jgi:hypothetical protein
VRETRGCWKEFALGHDTITGDLGVGHHCLAVFWSDNCDECLVLLVSAIREAIRPEIAAQVEQETIERCAKLRVHAYDEVERETINGTVKKGASYASDAYADLIRNLPRLYPAPADTPEGEGDVTTSSTDAT